MLLASTSHLLVPVQIPVQSGGSLTQALPLPACWAPSSYQGRHAYNSVWRGGSWGR